LRFRFGEQNPPTTKGNWPNIARRECGKHDDVRHFERAEHAKLAEFRTNSGVFVRRALRRET
jgi:hypothetical protein